MIFSKRDLETGAGGSHGRGPAGRCWRGGAAAGDKQRVSAEVGGAVPICRTCWPKTRRTGLKNSNVFMGWRSPLDGSNGSNKATTAAATTATAHKR